ncbi:hypothetical protein ACIQUE_11255 [Bacillus cereus]|nr:hypothetical protein [Bacillus cereus]MBV6705317.1 hypothetical protein [Bacillus thuringiensis]MCU5616723.1 hypothetical protein [Bacillus cereus]MDN4099793.1 hypothetical protein [Bacillus cereus]HDR3657972.1 hypothetical protein [Bacillus cereus]HDR7758892.1 hypothetical protein [Bacillus cereus]
MEDRDNSILSILIKKIDAVLFYPAICWAVRPPPQNAAKAKKLGGG